MNKYTPVTPKTEPARPSEAWSDIVKGFGYWRLWVTMAWHGLKQRYKRSWLGLGWLAVSFAMFTGVKIFVFGAISGTTIAYYAGHLTLGYLIYRLITNSVTGGASAFVSAQNWIKADPLPLSVHIYKLVTTNFIMFAFAAVPAIIICFYFRQYNIMALVCAGPALLVYAVNAVSVAISIGILSTRYRDIMHFVGTVMQILYFISPILWVPPEEGLRATVAYINPVTHYVGILREPMLDGTISLDSWLIVTGCTLVSMIIAFTLFVYSRRKLVFWL